MRIRITDRAWVKVFSFASQRESDRQSKDLSYLHARQELADIFAHLTYYRNTRRVRKILRAAGIRWEKA